MASGGDAELVNTERKLMLRRKILALRTPSMSHDEVEVVAESLRGAQRGAPYASGRRHRDIVFE